MVDTLAPVHLNVSPDRYPRNRRVPLCGAEGYPLRFSRHIEHVTCQHCLAAHRRDK